MKTYEDGRKDERRALLKWFTKQRIIRPNTKDIIIDKLKGKKIVEE